MRLSGWSTLVNEVLLQFRATIRLIGEGGERIAWELRMFQMPRILTVMAQKQWVGEGGCWQLGA
jgi:hypothetical protein